MAGQFVRKIMYFIWAYRDKRIRRFICERIADRFGEWRTRQIVNKQNADFFERWMQASTAKKARSNFEFFLVEAGIFNKEERTVHLELDDGWLEQAAIVAAQHEHDPVIREELLANPFEFLKARNWLGLINASNTESRSVSPMLTSDSSPLEDDTINVQPQTAPTSRDWDRNSPTTSGKKRTTTNIDLVARERANKSHYALEKELAKLAKAQGFSPKYNQNIDIY